MEELQEQINSLKETQEYIKQQINLLKGDYSVLHNLIISNEQSINTNITRIISETQARISEISRLNTTLINLQSRLDEN